MGVRMLLSVRDSVLLETREDCAIPRCFSLDAIRRDANYRPRDGRNIFISGPNYGWKQWSARASTPPWAEELINLA